MDFQISIWCAVGLALLLALIARRSNRRWMSIPQIESLPAQESVPDCMVVIPARNEEQIISRAVKSLPHDSVIVVDDHSSDRTAAMARAAGAGVLRAPTLIRGGNGKSNACAEGARVLTTKWILFADADTWFADGFLDSVTATAETLKADFLSVYLHPEYETLGEKIIGPLAVALYFFAVDVRKNATDGFDGHCVLVRRQAYEFVGGHGAIVKELNDDLTLAALALRHRMRIAVVRADHLGHARLRTEGFARQVHRFTQVNIWIGPQIVLATFTLALWGPVMLWLIWGRQWIAAAMLYIWLVVTFASRYEGLHRALLAPVGIYRLFGVLISGLFNVITGRSVRWKGRVI